MKAVSDSGEECESWFDNSQVAGIVAKIYMLYCDNAVRKLRTHSGVSCVKLYATITESFRRFCLTSHVLVNRQGQFYESIYFTLRGLLRVGSIGLGRAQDAVSFFRLLKAV